MYLRPCPFCGSEVELEKNLYGMETVEDIKTATNLKYGAKSVVAESINLKMILYTEAKKKPRKMRLKRGTGEIMTNADIVRAKSDMELAWLLFAYAHKWRRISFNQIYKWLQEETK